MLKKSRIVNRFARPIGEKEKSRIVNRFARHLNWLDTEKSLELLIGLPDT